MVGPVMSHAPSKANASGRSRCFRHRPSRAREEALGQKSRLHEKLSPVLRADTAARRTVRFLIADYRVPSPHFSSLRCLVLEARA